MVGFLVLYVPNPRGRPCRADVRFTLGDGVPMIALFIKSGRAGWVWEALLWLLVLELARLIGG